MSGSSGRGQPLPPTGSPPGAPAPAVAAPLVEPLEHRQMLSVSVSDGWTEITPGPDARVVYASSSQGSDVNDGLSPDSPVKTLAKAKKLVRNGAGDHLLLARGDTWREALGFWEASGRSADEPAVIGAYGDGARPVIYSGTATALSMTFKGVHDVVVSGIHFDGGGRGGAVPDGIVSTGKTTNLLIEDCEVEGYRNNITLQSFLGPITNVTVRRSAILDAWSRSSHAQGIYADGVKGITLEENVFDHNGWGNGAGQTMFNHAAYVTAKCEDLVAVGNVFANSSSHGLQARPGGTVRDNAFINNGIGMSYGLVNGDGSVKAGGVTGVVANNVFTGGHAIGNLPAGVGIEISNVKAAAVTENLFLDGDPKGRNAAINLNPIQGTTNAHQAVGINSLTVSHNIVHTWGQGMRVNKGMAIRDLVVRDNHFQNILYFQAVQNAPGTAGQTWSNNTYHVPGNAKTPLLVGGRGLTVAGWAKAESGARDERVEYLNPGVTVSSYAGDFLARARTLSKQGWDARYTAEVLVSYLKAGFGGGGGGGGGGEPPIISAPTA